MLQHHESNDDQIFAMSTLAVCSLGEHVRKRQVRQLIDIALESNQNIGKSKEDISEIKRKEMTNNLTQSYKTNVSYRDDRIRYTRIAMCHE